MSEDVRNVFVTDDKLNDCLELGALLVGYRNIHGKTYEPDTADLKKAYEKLVDDVKGSLGESQTLEIPAEMIDSTVVGAVNVSKALDAFKKGKLDKDDFANILTINNSGVGLRQSPSPFFGGFPGPAFGSARPTRPPVKPSSDGENSPA